MDLRGSAWSLVDSFTGTGGPSAADVFPGQHHYLHVVSDPSVVDYVIARK